MSGWEGLAMNDESEIELALWRVFEIPDEGRFFAGYNLGSQRGRTSSPIMSWDAELRLGITSSGRHYRLVGEPDVDGGAELVWRTVSRGAEFIDVTDQYVNAQREWRLQ